MPVSKAWEVRDSAYKHQSARDEHTFTTSCVPVFPLGTETRNESSSSTSSAAETALSTVSLGQFIHF
jgi:hypothetical protein